MRRNIVFIFFFLLLSSLIYAEENVDYSQKSHWLNLPSDISKPVDVFYLYPTVWKKSNPTEPDVCSVDNSYMILGAKEAFEKSATAFEPAGNIYAPYYRQAGMDVLFYPQEKQKAVIGGIPTTDAVAAFDYYLKNYNQGRPFILAAHSQGSNILLNILAVYMKEHPDVYKRMIAAYAIGYSVTREYLAQNPHLKFAQKADDIGVIISYNTEAPGVKGDNPVLLPDAISINPISWTLSEVRASAAESAGSRLLNPQKKWCKVYNYADAAVDQKRGVIICSTANVDLLAPGSSIFPKGVYHSYDYPFYYFNIRENVINRVHSFWLKTKK